MTPPVSANDPALTARCMADAILTISREQGGTFTAADLSEFQAEWVTPVKTAYRGWTVYEIGPSTQGVAALMMLNLMEQYPLGEFGFHSANALHVMIESRSWPTPICCVTSAIPDSGRCRSRRC